jgi:hypothetical protein
MFGKYEEEDISDIHSGLLVKLVICLYHSPSTSANDADLFGHTCVPAKLYADTQIYIYI